MKIMRPLGLGLALSCGLVIGSSRAEMIPPPPQPPVCTPLAAVPASAPPSARAFAVTVKAAKWSVCRHYSGEVEFRATLLQRAGSVCRLRLRSEWGDPEPGIPTAPDVWGWTYAYRWAGAGPCPDTKPADPYQQVSRAYTHTSPDLADKEFLRIQALLKGFKPSAGGAAVKDMTPEVRAGLSDALANPHHRRTIHRKSWLFGLFRSYRVNISDWGDGYDLTVWEIFGRAWVRKAQSYMV